MSKLITVDIAKTQRLLLNTVVMCGSQAYPWTPGEICGWGCPDHKNKHCD